MKLLRFKSMIDSNLSQLVFFFSISSCNDSNSVSPLPNIKPQIRPNITDPPASASDFLIIFNILSASSEKLKAAAFLFTSMGTRGLRSRSQIRMSTLFAPLMKFGIFPNIGFNLDLLTILSIRCSRMILYFDRLSFLSFGKESYIFSAIFVCKTLSTPASLSQSPRVIFS